jgi:uncharacterized protein YraI
MKKIVSLLLSLAMVLSMCSFASADSLAGTYDIKVWVANEIVDLTKKQIENFNATNDLGIVFNATIEAQGEGDAATATATASPTVSPSPTPSATTGTARTEVYSADAAFASTINPDSANVPAGATNGYIVGNDVNFRGGPSASARLLGTYDSGTRVRILGTENGWTEVVINGVTGYVSSQYVSYGTAGGGSSVIVSGSGNTMVIVPDGPASSSGAVIAPDDGDYFLGIKPD